MDIIFLRYSFEYLAVEFGEAFYILCDYAYSTEMFRHSNISFCGDFILYFIFSCVWGIEFNPQTQTPNPNIYRINTIYAKIFILIIN